MISLAFSWSFQNVGLFISRSSESRRDCFSPKSKRVSELEDLIDDAFGRTFQFGIHGRLLTRDRGVNCRLSRRRAVRVSSMIRRGSRLRSIRPDRATGDQSNLGTGEGSRSAMGLSRDSTPASRADRSAASPPRRPAGCTWVMRGTFLIAWLAARQDDGRVILRIEDLDASRVRAEARQSILAGPPLAGLDWDEGPDVGGPSRPLCPVGASALVPGGARSSQGAPIVVYPCTCTRADIERAASAPHAEDEGPSYPGTCANRPARDAERSGRSPVRLAVPRPPAADRLGRPLPGPSRDRPGPIGRGLHRCPPRTSARPISSPSWSTTPRWASTRSSAAPTSCPARRDRSSSTGRSAGPSRLSATSRWP